MHLNIIPSSTPLWYENFLNKIKSKIFRYAWIAKHDNAMMKNKFCDAIFYKQRAFFLVYVDSLENN